MSYHVYAVQRLTRPLQAIFSTIFFETSPTSGGTSPTGLSVTKGWWLFPAITIPLTILIFFIWNIWRTRRNKLQVQDLQHLNSYALTPGVSLAEPEPQGIPYARPSFRYRHSRTGYSDVSSWRSTSPSKSSTPCPPAVSLQEGAPTGMSNGTKNRRLMPLSTVQPAFLVTDLPSLKAYADRTASGSDQKQGILLTSENGNHENTPGE